jgi:uncharacterized protein (DUF4213/DUF364 family)
LAANHRVTDVRIGLGYTGVQLDNGRCGLAFTFRQEARGGCCAFREAGTLAGKLASEVAWCATSPDVITAAVGLATLNALTDPPLGAGVDALEVLAVEAEDEIGMVGHFTPLVEPLRKRARVLHIFERQPDRAAGLLPEHAAAEILPRCQVVILTATSLLNRTMDKLLDYCWKAREIVVLGPSTPLLPEVFAPHGVTLLSGVRVTDPARALQIISEGGGTMKLLSAMRKVSLRTGAQTAAAAP